jgi:hypothetical protein
MKKLLFCFVALTSINTYKATAQQTATLEINKVLRPAQTFEVGGKVEDVEDALVDFFKARGVKKEKLKGGVLYFKNAKVEGIPVTMDYCFGVDKKSKKEKDVSTILMVTSTGTDSFTTATSNYYTATTALGKKLETVVIPLALMDKKIKDAEKEINNTTNDVKDLEKKKGKIEKDIEETQQKVAAQKTALDALQTQKATLQKQQDEIFKQ